MPSALDLYNETWEQFKAAKLSKEHQIAKTISDIAKKAVGVNRWKDAVIQIPATLAKQAASSAASVMPGLNILTKFLVNPIVDAGADLLVTKMMKADTDIGAKTDIKATFELKTAKDGSNALKSLPKHVAQLVEAHEVYHNKIDELKKRLSKPAKDKAKETLDAMKELFTAYHVMRWATIKVSRDAGVLRQALEKIEDLENKNLDWLVSEGKGIIDLVAAYMKSLNSD